MIGNEIKDEKIREFMGLSVNSYFERINKVLRMESMKSLKKLCQRVVENKGLDQKAIKEVQKLLLEYIDNNSEEKTAGKSNFSIKVSQLKEDLIEKEQTLKEEIKKKRVDENTAELFLNSAAIKRFRFS